jgi:outer membrane protein assembly factor BamA
MIYRLRSARRNLVVLATVLSLILPQAAFAVDLVDPAAGGVVAAAAPVAPAPAAAAPLVVSVDVSGNAHVPSDRILSVVKSKVGQPFDEKAVRDDIQAIFDLGYFTDQVPPLIRQRPDGVAITFRVVENPVIQRITFTGNDHVASDTLLALMDTAVGQVLNTNTFHQDVLKINSYYDKIGYGGQLPTHVIGLNISKDGVLSMTVREGLTVGKIKFAGIRIIRDDLIKGVLTLKEGQPYSEDTRDKDYEALKKLYEKYDLSIGDFEAGIDPSSVNVDKGTADVLYTINVAVVGAVQITGNTKTKDEVVRRQLRLRPGMIITQGLLHRDYDRLNNLGFFEKVELNPKPGPDPKKPWETTLDWNVKEQRTGTAQIGAGYSGGPNGEGLTGTLSYSENNINGTGNGAQIRFERGARVSDASIQYTVPYLGNTTRSQKYSMSASLFTQNLNNFYQVYGASAAQAVAPNPIISTPPPTGSSAAASTDTGTIPVVLTPNADLLTGVAANYANKSGGLSLNIGRRLSDTLTATLGVTAQRLSTDVQLPAPYFLASQTNIFNAPLTTSPFGSPDTSGSTLGITATSIANTSSGQSFNLRSLTFGLANDTRDDVFNPRRGVNATITEEVSNKAVGSAFSYTITTFDGSKFFPVLKSSTLGFHALIGATTGAIPPSKLFVFSDQQLRGYSQVFYGTEALLFQSELRVPLSPDRSFNLAFFTDYGSLRIRGADPLLDTFGNVVVDYNQWLYHLDAGFGLRFDVKQLGFRSIRLDFAHGKGTNHTSFGIGQSF